MTNWVHALDSSRRGFTRTSYNVVHVPPAGAFGKLLRRPGVVWSQAPVALAYSQPYAIATLPDHVEASSNLTAHWRPHSTMQISRLQSDMLDWRTQLVV